MASNFRGNPAPKPYAFVPFASAQPDRQQPTLGQQKFGRTGQVSGRLDLELTVKTTTFVASGIVARGQDVGLRESVVKTAVLADQSLVIPGSSLKGVVRSVYEALTKSCVCKTKAKIPKSLKECSVKGNESKICPACRAFGAMSWQGLIQFTDAKGNTSVDTIGFMPSLYAPRPKSPAYTDRQGSLKGRKFYYQATTAVDKGKQGIPVQAAGVNYMFRGQVRVKNLSFAEFGALLLVLGQDPQHPLALKAGGGKPVGMGALGTKVAQFEQVTNWPSRYQSYDATGGNILTGANLEQFMQSAIAEAKKDLVQTQALQTLTQILRWPTTRTAPKGLY